MFSDIVLLCVVLIFCKQDMNISLTLNTQHAYATLLDIYCETNCHHIRYILKERRNATCKNWTRREKYAMGCFINFQKRLVDVLTCTVYLVKYVCLFLLTIYFTKYSLYFMFKHSRSRSAWISIV